MISRFSLIREIEEKKANALLFFLATDSKRDGMRADENTKLQTCAALLVAALCFAPQCPEQEGTTIAKMRLDNNLMGQSMWWLK